MLLLSVWYDIPGFEKFKVNKKGEISSLIKGKTNLMHQTLRESGHYTVYLSITREKKQTLHVDKIVATVFLDNPYNFKYVAHKDGNRGNNHVNNLVWSPYPELLEGEWRRIPGYSTYIVSEKGDMRSLRSINFTLLTPSSTMCGYSRYNIYSDEGKRNDHPAHELVSMSFIPNPNNYKFLTHIDKNLQNDHYSNLRWSKTSEEDTEDMSAWKRLEGYPDYLFSDKGEVKSYQGIIPKFLNPTCIFDGYKKLNLYNKKGRRLFYLHVIIAKLFVPNPHNHRYVDHIDRNKWNSEASNLRWVTASENAKNVDVNTIFGLSRAVLKCDLTGTIIEKYLSAEEAARRNPDVPVSHIRDFANEKTTINRGILWIWETDNAEPYQAQEGEIFKQIVGDFDGYNLNYPNYQISNFGTLINAKNLRLKPSLMIYPKTTLYNKGKSFQFLIHRLVALFFVAGRTAERYMVNHIDENKNNYHFSNLEWCTPAENSFHSRYKNAKAVKQIDPVTNEVVAIHKSHRDAYKSLGKNSCGAISAVIAGIIKTSHGFKWERVTDLNDIFQ